MLFGEYKTMYGTLETGNSLNEALQKLSEKGYLTNLSLSGGIILPIVITNVQITPTTKQIQGYFLDDGNWYNVTVLMEKDFLAKSYVTLTPRTTPLMSRPEVRNYFALMAKDYTTVAENLVTPE